MGRRKRNSNAPYRSKFEASVGDSLKDRGVSYGYESEKLRYVVPKTSHIYTPDWTLSNGIIVETKGRLTVYDRKKMVLVRDANPERDIRFVFQRASNPIRKGSKTTYADWATKNGFKWAEGDIPDEWIRERGNKKHKSTRKP